MRIAERERKEMNSQFDGLVKLIEGIQYSPPTASFDL
jgi:hypothetical protein